MGTQHPSPAGANPWGDTEATTTQSPDTLKEWGCTEGWATGRGTRKSQGAQRSSEDPSIQAERMLTGLSFLPPPVGASSWEAEHREAGSRTACTHCTQLWFELKHSLPAGQGHS